MPIPDYRQIWGEAKKQARKIPEYAQMTKRPYANPKDYSPFESVAERIATQIYAACHLFNGETIGFAEEVAWPLSVHICRLKAPVYWMQSDLLQALMHTRVPRKIGYLHRVIPCGVIMLPENRIFTPDREAIDFIAFYHLTEGEKLPDIVTRKAIIRSGVPSCDRLWISTITHRGAVYSSSSDLTLESGSLGINSGNWRESPLKLISPFAQNPVEAEQNFLRTLESLTLQTILLKQSRPDLIEDNALPQSLKGVANTRKLPPLQPRWIGRHYVLKRSGTGTGTHASPEAHWREGHERRVAVGKGRTGREWRWIEPTLVNAQHYGKNHD